MGDQPDGSPVGAQFVDHGGDRVERLGVECPETLIEKHLKPLLGKDA